MSPLVSICIPTYNAEDFIMETLLSIKNQTYSNIEIIVGDNCSDDETEVVVNNFVNKFKLPINYYKNEENLGYAGNCNKLIREAKGEYVAIYHSDDLYDPSIVETQVKLLETNPDFPGCFSQFVGINEEGNYLNNRRTVNTDSSEIDVYTKKSFLDSLLNRGANPFFCPSSMVRKKAYDEAGGYDENTKYIEDQDMWLRLLDIGSLAVINKQLVKYRVHKKQVSTIYRNVSRDALCPMIQHLQDYLKSQCSGSDYEKMFKKKIDRLAAVDDIRIAYYATKLQNEDGRRIYQQLILKSINKYRLMPWDFQFMKYFFLQVLPPKLSYFCLKKI